MTEKIVNSIDAILLKECQVRNIEPLSEQAPISMRDAIKKFFGIMDGMLGNADPKTIKNLADNIQVIVSGYQKTPCYTIIDKGEGQHPKDFPDTYVSLSRKNKEGIRFVQGKYNMGGSAAISLCGNKFYQLIIAKRHNELVKDKKNNPWGFTLIRRRAPREHEALPVVEYFILGGKKGEIASFIADSLPLLPFDKDDLLKEPLEYGTFIKLYDYKMGPSDRSVDLGLNNALCRTMYMCCLPMWLKDARVARGHTWDRTFCGADVRLEKEEQAYILGQPFSFDLNIKNIGNIKCVAIPFTRKISWMWRYSTLYIMNGQTHAHESQDFLDKANLSWLKKRVLVVVDCTEMNKEAFHLVFKPDRERMSEQPQAITLRKELCMALGRHQGLKELNRRIHEEAAMNVAKDETDIQDIFSKLAQSDPNMAALFDVGGKLLTLIKSRKGAEQEFKGRKFPTILKPVVNINKKGPFQIEAGSYRFIKAITDAENDYLMRPRLRGKLVYKPEEWSISCNLSNGIVNFKIVIPDDAKTGEIVKVFLGFKDVEKINPLGFEFDAEIVPKIKTEEPEEPEDEPEKEPEEEKPPKRPKLKEQLTRNMPKIFEVWEDDQNWERFDMDNKTGFKIMTVPESTAIEIYLNMSNIYLTQFLMKYKQSAEIEIVKKQYKIGMALAGCALWQRVKKDEHRDKIIDLASSSLSQVILSVIRKLGSLSNLESSGAILEEVEIQ
ncbi:hypothetical protein ES707_19599 [subsurface metagenome]